MSPATELRDFQDAFASALIADDPEANAGAGLNPELAAQLTALVSQPGFAVYRNTVMKACVDALAANFPAIVALVGEQWFRAAAAVYVRGQLPDNACMLHYGAGFVSFLRAFEPAADLPYLPDVAQLDRMWCESHGAADAVSVAPDMLLNLSAQAIESLVLRPHPSARWIFSADMPVASIWQRNTDRPGVSSEVDHDAEIAWHGEGLLLVRPDDTVGAWPIGRAECAFLDACAAGATLSAAAICALEVDATDERASAQVDIAHLLARLLDAGTLVA